MLDPLTYTIEGASAASGLGKTKLYNLIARRLIDARKADGRTLILADSLRRYLESLPAAAIRAGRREAA